MGISWYMTKWIFMESNKQYWYHGVSPYFSWKSVQVQGFLHINLAKKKYPNPKVGGFFANQHLVDGLFWILILTDWLVLNVSNTCLISWFLDPMQAHVSKKYPHVVINEQNSGMLTWVLLQIAFLFMFKKMLKKWWTNVRNSWETKNKTFKSRKNNNQQFKQKTTKHHCMNSRKKRNQTTFRQIKHNSQIK